MITEEYRLSLIKEVMDRRKAGAIEPDKLELLYIKESEAQLDYDPDGPTWQYDNGSIVDADTGTSAPASVRKAIEDRVNLRIPTVSTVGEDLIRILQSWDKEADL